MAFSVNDFGRAVVAAGLVPAEDLHALVAACAADARPRTAPALAKLLVDQNRLTQYQADELLAGRGPALVLGEYVIQDKIGAGGMGQVLKAVHRKMGRTVALKLISAAAMKDEAAIKRFHREVKAAARLEHENIVTAHTAGEARGMHYLVMQYVEGVDLSGRVKKGGPLSVDLAMDCICQSARGLAYAHSEGIIHRDIKPANLLLDKKGVVKILDMGLARIDGGDHDGLTGTEQVLGTVDYMSPEQAVSTRDCDARADIYSLGCTLWYLLSGTKMYSGDSPIQRLMQHREAPLPSLLTSRDDIPWALEKLFHKMVAKKPDDRIQTMDEVVLEIEQIRGGPETSRTNGLEGDTNLGQFLITVGGKDSSRSSTKVKALAGKSSAKDGDTLDYSDSRKTLPATAGQIAIWKNPKLLAGAAAAFVLILAGIIIILKNNKGEEVGRVQVPDGGSFEVQNPGTEVRSRESAKTKNPKSQTSNPNFPPPLAVAPFDAKQARVHQDAWAKHLSTPVNATNSIGMKLALIPPGEFMMGSTPEQIETLIKAASSTASEVWLNSIRSEGPQHRVQITRPFQIGTTEVTIGQFKRFVEATKYVPEAEKLGGGTRRDTKENKDVTDPALTWRAPGYEVTDESPVTEITWNDAVKFCAWLKAQEKSTYRLPTEAEWEYSCRAGAATVFPYGDDLKPLGDYAWVKTNSAGSAHAVGAKLANAFGLYDMIGNVMEFCQDWHALNWYETSPTNDPVGPSSGTARVVRGGHVGNTGPDMRPAFRYSKASATTRSNSFGFRVVREMALPPSPSPTPSATPPVDVDRKAAEWVVARGGHVYVAVKGKVGPEINVSSELPAEAFELRVILEYGMKPPMTDADYAQLGKLPHLEKSSMSIGNLSETRLKWLESLPKLNALDFSSRLIEISDAALDRLTRLTNLTYLRFGATNVSDAGLPYIARCTKLGQLHLASAPISDAALPHLESLKSLARLDLRGTKVTAAGIAKLQKALPNCKIEWDGAAKEVAVQPNQPWNTPAFQAWMKTVATMPAEKQVEAVSKKLMELNPGFDGKIAGADPQKPPNIAGGIVLGLGFYSNYVTDLSPVRVLQGLTTLRCNGSDGTIAPLSDLSPLEGMPLTYLNCGGSNVSDLSRLKGMKLTTLYCGYSNVSDLSALKGMPLSVLQFDNSQVRNLSALSGMPLQQLRCDRTLVSDLSPLRGMPLDILFCNFRPARDADILRSIKSLKTVNGKPAAEFWQDVEARQAAFEQWLKDTQTLPAEQQIEAVSKKLMEFNPGFDGKMTPKIDKGVVTGLTFVSNNVPDISPVRAFSGLKALNCNGSTGAKSRLSDLSPLVGMPLTTLHCINTQVSDLSPLQSINLADLRCTNTNVIDLSPLKGSPLVLLWCDNTLVSDLSPLASSKNLQTVKVTQTKVTPASVAALQKALPNCKIEWDQTK